MRTKRKPLTSFVFSMKTGYNQRMDVIWWICRKGVAGQRMLPMRHYIKWKCESEVTQSCLTLCNPMHYSPPGSSIHGIFQALLEWVAISFSRGSSWPRDWTQGSPALQADALPSEPPGGRYIKTLLQTWEMSSANQWKLNIWESSRQKAPSHDK